MIHRDLYLLLGTNLGDRETNVAHALAELGRSFGTLLQYTGTIETQACGFDGPPFLNAVAVYRSCLKPETVLKICKRIERSMGRTDAPEYDAQGRRVYHNRLIDIDILMYGDLLVNTPTLRIPHPQVQERPFVGALLGKLKPIPGAD